MPEIKQRREDGTSQLVLLSTFVSFKRAKYEFYIV